MELSCDRPLAITREDAIRIRGKLTLTSVGPDGEITDQREGYNLVTTTGFTALAAALVWSGLQDQASNLGVTTATYLTPLWGAVGSSGTAATKADTQLGAELGRATVTGGGATPASVSVAGMSSWLFYFTNPPSTWTVAEAGLFASATSAANTGTMLNHWVFSPTVSVPTTNTLILEVSFLFGP